MIAVLQTEGSERFKFKGQGLWYIRTLRRLICGMDAKCEHIPSNEKHVVFFSTPQESPSNCRGKLISIFVIKKSYPERVSVCGVRSQFINCG